MVILRAQSIAREVEGPGKCKIAAAPDSRRSNEPWQWRLLLNTGAQGDPEQWRDDNLVLPLPGAGGTTSLELAVDTDGVTAAMSSETINTGKELSRADGELLLVYVASGALDLGEHTIGAGDAVVLSGGEHHTVPVRPVATGADVALVRLAPQQHGPDDAAERLASDDAAGLVWIP